MQTHQRIWNYLQQHRAASIVVAHISVGAVLGTFLLSNMLGFNIFGVFAMSHCSGSDQSYRVASGDTLAGIGSHFGTNWQRLASYNHIGNPNIIYINQVVCIPGKAAPISFSPAPSRGIGNLFPYGQCTWYANQRFYQLHHVYVPWTLNSNAWQWSARARDFGWHVSSSPSPGAIVDLQPWVQGAYGLGHVAVVERVLSNGTVVASNMNWGAFYWQVTQVQFRPGPGVTFISY